MLRGDLGVRETKLRLCQLPELCSGPRLLRPQHVTGHTLIGVWTCVCVPATLSLCPLWPELCCVEHLLAHRHLSSFFWARVRRLFDRPRLSNMATSVDTAGTRAEIGSKMRNKVTGSAKGVVSSSWDHGVPRFSLRCHIVLVPCLLDLGMSLGWVPSCAFSS
jgi:hypothetical protein